MVGIPTNGRYTDLSGSPGWSSALLTFLVSIARTESAS